MTTRHGHYNNYLFTERPWSIYTSNNVDDTCYNLCLSNVHTIKKKKKQQKIHLTKVHNLQKASQM